MACVSGIDNYVDVTFKALAQRDALVLSYSNIRIEFRITLSSNDAGAQGIIFKRVCDNVVYRFLDEI